MESQLTELLQMDVFTACTAEDLSGVSGAMTGVLNLSDGDVLCRAGDAADRWWIIRDGLADVTVHGLYLATIGRGETVGEQGLFDGAARTATVTAATDMVVFEFDGAGLIDAVSASPRLALSLLRQMSARLGHANGLSYGLSLGEARAAAPATSRIAFEPPVESQEPVSFNPLAPGYFDNPYPQYAALRERDPVHFEPMTGSYVMTRYADVHRFARDRSLLSAIERATPNRIVDAEVVRRRESPVAAAKMMLGSDGDDHARLRGLVSKVFTPSAVSAWRDRTEAVVESLLDRAAGLASIDVIDDYALLLPAQIISEMLGLPESDIPQLRDWSHAMTKALDPLIAPDEEAAAGYATEQIGDYLKAAISEKRSHPGDDILTKLIEVEEAGESLSTSELVAQVVLLYVAGHETTLNLIGNGLVHLFEFPSQFGRLLADPGLDTNAIEELLRYDSPVQFTRRIAVDSFEVQEVTIPAGSVVLLGLGAANRDPDMWGPSADTLDLTRIGANRHAAFGGGAHYCLGASLARLEGQVALPRLIRRFPHMAPAYDTPQWGARIIMRGVEKLPVTLASG